MSVNVQEHVDRNRYRVYVSRRQTIRQSQESNIALKCEESEDLEVTNKTYLVLFGFLVLFTIAILYVRHNYISVSYTHLDVYKRQLLYLNILMQ